MIRCAFGQPSSSTYPFTARERASGDAANRAPSAIRDPVPRKPNSTRSRFNRKVETQQAIRACTGQETDEAERCPTSLERSGGDDQEDGQGGLRDLGHELNSAPTRFQEEHM